jgi:hypothetical protein
VARDLRFGAGRAGHVKASWWAVAQARGSTSSSNGGSQGGAGRRLTDGLEPGGAISII